MCPHLHAHDEQLFSGLLHAAGLVSYCFSGSHDVRQSLCVFSCSRVPGHFRTSTPMTNSSSTASSSWFIRYSPAICCGTTSCNQDLSIGNWVQDDRLIK